jgi:methylase of polypeptide subunit release factors
MALSDHADGLSFYRFFADIFPSWMLPNAPALLEFGGNHQTLAMHQIFSNYDRDIKKDYQQDDRFIIVKVKKEA